MNSFERMFDYKGKGFVLEIDNKPYSYSKRKEDLFFLREEFIRRGIRTNNLRIRPVKIPKGLKITSAIG